VESPRHGRASADVGSATGTYVLAMSAMTHQPATRTAATFTRILCATDLSTGGAAAVSQAAILAGAGTTLETHALAPRAGADELLARSAGHDLLVVPAGDAAGSALAAADDIPVLVARALPEGCTFPESILVALDATPAAHAAARLAGRLAAEHGALIAVVATPEHDAPHRHALEEDVAAITRLTSTRPLVLDEQCPPVRAIVGAARRLDATLIVLGSRPGTPAGSVSAEVARTAHCSVLVLRPSNRPAVGP
jgi:nucleotide-binding universal stress UspA family protein